MFDDGPKAVNQHTTYSWVGGTFQKTTLVTRPVRFKNSTLKRHVAGAWETQLTAMPDTPRLFWLQKSSSKQGILNTAKRQRLAAKESATMLIAVCRQYSRLLQQEFRQAAHSASSALLFHTTWRMLRALLRLSGPNDPSFRRRGHSRLDYFQISIVARTLSED